MVNIEGYNYCENDNNISNCEIIAQNLYLNQLDQNICIKCSDGFVKLISFKFTGSDKTANNYSNVNPDLSDFPYIEDPLSVTPGLHSCENLAVSN